MASALILIIDHQNITPRMKVRLTSIQSMMIKTHRSSLIEIDGQGYSRTSEIMICLASI